MIAVVTGEGGSGGALAISVANRILMLEYSIYSVAPSEAAASILWRDTAFAPQAANASVTLCHCLKQPNFSISRRYLIEDVRSNV